MRNQDGVGKLKTEESTGSGGVEQKATAVRSRQDTGEHLKRSRSRQKKRTEKISKSDAMGMLASAIRYAQEAGLQIEGYYDGGALFLRVRGIEEGEKKISFSEIGVNAVATKQADGVSIQESKSNSVTLTPISGEKDAVTCEKEV